MEAIRDSAARRVQHRCLSLDRPIALQRRAAGRCEIGAALVADVGLGRAQVVPVCGGLYPLAVDRAQVAAEIARAGVSEQELEDRLRVLVLALPEMVVADP